MDEAAALQGRRILIVEDEYMLAEELRAGLLQVGAIVLGPVGSCRGALELIEAEPVIAGALVNINLRGQDGFPVADLLLERDVPFVFVTGYDRQVLPGRFAGITRLDKPTEVGKVARMIGRLIRD